MSKNANAEEVKPKLIDKLTPEQEAKIQDYIDQYRKIGLSTRPTDRNKAEKAIRAAYAYLVKHNNIPQNDLEIVWAESPFEGAKLAAQYAKGDENVTNKEIQDQASLASYGSFESYWVSTYAFITEQLPVEKDELIDIIKDIIAEAGVYWTFEDLVVMTPKPSSIVMNKDEKLHNLEGPALQYANGDAIYAVNGERKGSLMEVVMAARNSE